MNTTAARPESVQAEAGSPTTGDTPKQETGGRDAGGRFTKGNSGGPGNPFARRVARLRSVMLACSTDEDMKVITEMLIVMARTGDLAAIKLYYEYVVGKPRPAGDPDTVDYQEFELYCRSPHGQQLQELLRERVPAGDLVELLRMILPAAFDRFANALLDSFKECDPTEAAHDTDEAKVETAAQSTNGSSSQDPCPTVTPPSTNGSIPRAERAYKNGATTNGKQSASKNGTNGAHGDSPDRRRERH